MCDCSGTANFSFADVEFMASICPSCLIEGSVVTFNETNFSFVSNSIDRPTCILADDGGTLATKGTGTVTIDGETIPVVFTVNLVDGPGENDDATTFIATGFDEMGEPVVFSLVAIGLPEENVTVTDCNSTTIDNGFNSNTNISNITKGFSEIKILRKGKWHYNL
jgi:hypothetical protein